MAEPLNPNQTSQHKWVVSLAISVRGKRSNRKLQCTCHHVESEGGLIVLISAGYSQSIYYTPAGGGIRRNDDSSTAEYPEQEGGQTPIPQPCRALDCSLMCSLAVKERSPLALSVKRSQSLLPATTSTIRDRGFSAFAASSVT